MKESFGSRPALNILGKPSRIANNTFKWTDGDGATVYRLHKTDILLIEEDGRQHLNSGGYRTHTTKDRLNTYLQGYVVFSDRGVWKVRRHSDGETVPFEDGMVLPDAFDSPVERKHLEKVEKERRKLIQKINTFVAKVDKVKKLPEPGPGDCWMCCMRGQDGKTWGDHNRDASHLMEHLKEGYLHGSLIVNALLDSGRTNPGLFYALDRGPGTRDIIKNALRRYLKKRLGLEV